MARNHSQYEKYIYYLYSKLKQMDSNFSCNLDAGQIDFINHKYNIAGSLVYSDDMSIDIRQYNICCKHLKQYPQHTYYIFNMYQDTISFQPLVVLKSNIVKGKTRYAYKNGKDIKLFEQELQQQKEYMKHLTVYKGCPALYTLNILRKLYLNSYINTDLISFKNNKLYYNNVKYATLTDFLQEVEMWKTK